jgi:IS30 family transposase
LGGRSDELYRHNAVVLTEQKSRFILAARQDDKKSLTTASSIKRLFKGLPGQAKNSITFDNGGEFAGHKRSTAVTRRPGLLCLHRLFHV